MALATAFAAAIPPPPKERPPGKKEGPPHRRRITIAARTGTRGSIHNADEVHEAVRRAKALKCELGERMPGKSISETLIAVSADIADRLKGHYTAPWELEDAAEAKAQIAALNEEEEKEVEGAAVKIQGLYRRREAMREVKSRKIMMSRKSLSHQNVDAEKEKEQDKDKSWAHKDYLSYDANKSGTGEWHPLEVRFAIQELMDRLNTEETLHSLESTNASIQARVHGEEGNEAECVMLEELADQVGHASDEWLKEIVGKIYTSDSKTAMKIKAVDESGGKMIDLGTRAVAVRDKLRKKLESDHRLNLGDSDRSKLEEKRQWVAQLGNRLVEIRSKEESDTQTSFGHMEITNQKIEVLKAQIKAKQEEVNALTYYFDTIERYVRILEATLEYLNHDHSKGQMPEEGVLETIEEVKSIVRQTRIMPMLQQQDVEHASLFEPPDLSEIVALEEEIAHYQAMLAEVEESTAALSTPVVHGEQVSSRLAMICGAFATESGVLEPTRAPDVVPEEASVLQESLLVQIQQTHDQLKPGLKQLTRFENLMRNAQRSLELLASQRDVFLEHIRSLKDGLVKDAESMAVRPNFSEADLMMQPHLSRLMNKEERLRQSIQAFHDGEDAICGGVEEFIARLDFLKDLVTDGLKTSDRLRNYCDRNRWEIQDILGAPVEAFRPTSQPDPTLASFAQDSKTLIEGASALRRQCWEEQLAKQEEEGKQAAATARELLATKAAIAAEVEARAVVDWLDDGSEYSEADHEEESAEEDDEMTGKPTLKGVQFSPEASLKEERDNDKQSGMFSNKRRRTPPKIKLQKRGEKSKRRRSPPINSGPGLMMEPMASSKQQNTPGAAKRGSFAMESPGSLRGSRRGSMVGIQRPSLVGSSGALNIPGASSSPAMPTGPPRLPPQAHSGADIVIMHNLNLKLASGVDQAAFACRSLAQRLGGNPLEPARCHVLVGAAEDKENIKDRMESLIADRRRWWASRQLVTLDPDEHEPVESSKEAKAHAAAIERLRRSMDDDFQWVQEDAVVQLQSMIRGMITRKKLFRAREQHAKEFSAALSIQRLARGKLARAKSKHKKSMLKATVKIQALVRGNLDRKKANEQKKHKVSAAVTIQRSMRARKSIARGSMTSRSSVAKKRGSLLGPSAGEQQHQPESEDAVLKNVSKEETDVSEMSAEPLASEPRTSAADPEWAAAKKIQAGFRKARRTQTVQASARQSGNASLTRALTLPVRSRSKDTSNSPEHVAAAKKIQATIRRRQSVRVTLAAEEAPRSSDATKLELPELQDLGDRSPEGLSSSPRGSAAIDAPRRSKSKKRTASKRATADNPRGLEAATAASKAERKKTVKNSPRSGGIVSTEAAANRLAMAMQLDQDPEEALPMERRRSDESQSAGFDLPMEMEVEEACAVQAPSGMMSASFGMEAEGEGENAAINQMEEVAGEGSGSAS